MRAITNSGAVETQKELAFLGSCYDPQRGSDITGVLLIPLAEIANRGAQVDHALIAAEILCEMPRPPKAAPSGLNPLQRRNPSLHQHGA
jgi:hypothetical protein